MSGQPPGSLRRRILEALLLVLAVSFGVHIAAGLLAPVTPALVVLIVVITLFTLIVRGRR